MPPSALRTLSCLTDLWAQVDEQNIVHERIEAHIGRKNMPHVVANKLDPKTLPAAPIEYAGQWVAWDRKQTKIIAHGMRIAEVHEAALASGHPNAIFQKVPKADSYFIGAS